MHTSMKVMVTLPATDLERARRFYVDTLGFQLETGPEEGMFILKAGEDRFMVYETKASSGGNTAAAFMADDFDGEAEEFRRRGIKFEEYPELEGVTWDNGIADYRGMRTFWFTDSEGNIVAVTDQHAFDQQMPKAA